jgi:hypothetical protein
VHPNQLHGWRKDARLGSLPIVAGPQGKLERNHNPRPYAWKAEGSAILEKIKRARAALLSNTCA